MSADELSWWARGVIDAARHARQNQARWLAQSPGVCRRIEIEGPTLLVWELARSYHQGRTYLRMLKELTIDLCEMLNVMFSDVCDRRKDLWIYECDANLMDMILCN